MANTNLENCVINNHASVVNYQDYIADGTLPSHVLIEIYANDLNPAPSTSTTGEDGYWAVSATDFSISGSTVYTVLSPSSDFGNDANDAAVSLLGSIGNTNKGYVFDKAGMVGTIDGEEKWSDFVDKVMIVDKGTPGTESNIVQVYIMFQRGFSMPDSHTSISVDIDGDAQWYDTLRDERDKSIDFEFEIFSPIKEGPINTFPEKHVDYNPEWTQVEVATASSGFTLTEEVGNSGFENQRRRYIFSGKVNVDEPTVVGTLTVTAHLLFVTEGQTSAYADDEFGYYFQKAPSLKPSNELSSRYVTLKETSKKFSTLYKSNKPKRIASPHYKNKVVEYTYDVIYKSPTPTSLSDGIRNELIYSMNQRAQQVFEIHGVEYGRPTINANGETRTITVKGTPYSLFEITINEQFEDIVTAASGEETEHIRDGASRRRVIFKHNDESIINSENTKLITPGGKINTINISEYAKEINSVHGTLDKTGRYVFTQYFPSSTVATTRFYGGFSGVKGGIRVDNAEGAKVGDRIFSDEITAANMTGADFTYIATLTSDFPHSSGDYYEFNTFGNLTVSDNARVTIKRSRVYGINLESYNPTDKEVKSTLISSIPNQGSPTPTFRLRQFIDPSVTFHIDNMAAINIQQFNGVNTSLANGADHYSLYKGVAGRTTSQLVRKSQVENQFDLSWKLFAHAGGTAFSGAPGTAACRPPFYSQAPSQLYRAGGVANGPTDYGTMINNPNTFTSDWRFKVASGGVYKDAHPIDPNTGQFDMDIRITNQQLTFSTTTDANDTCTLTATVIVSKWPNRPILMVLDLADIFTVA